MKPALVVVMGDVHHEIALAAEGLEQIEGEFDCPIAQTFCVGDLGLFLDIEDWEFLTGPKKYRNPEGSPAIHAAWDAWRWPLSTIAGNHEPFQHLRSGNLAHFAFKLEYTNAGELPHSLPGIRVAGLSGIYHPEHLEFVSNLERRTMKIPTVDSWSQMVELTKGSKISRSRLTYYKEHEINHLKALKPSPHLLLLHDWPTTPDHISQVHDRRPETEIVEALRPDFVCCGHHHTAADFSVGASRVLALNLIHHKTDYAHQISPGWAAVFLWNGKTLDLQRTWPGPK